VGNKEQKKRPTLCVDLLNTFTVKELNGFQEFLTCSYFNTDKLVIQLFKALQKHVIQQHFFNATLQCRVYEVVFKKLAAEKINLSIAQKTQLNRKLSLLLRLAEEFIAINNLRDNKYSNIDYLYPELLKRKQHSLYKRHFKKEESKFELTKLKDINYYDNQSKFYGLHLDYLHIIQKMEKEGNIDKYIYLTDLTFLIKRLSIQATVLSLNRYSASNIDSKMYKALDDLLDLPVYASNSLVKLHQTSIDLIGNMDNQSFENLLNFIKNEYPSIPNADLSSLYFIGLNYCSSKIRMGNFEFYKRSFNLYLDMHIKNLLLNENFINSTSYTNIITACCRAQQFGWAKKLCEIYSQHLIKKIAKSVYNYNLGLIEFFQKEYETAHTHFLLTQKTNTIIDFNVRLYILQCLFESRKDFSFQFSQSIKSTKEFFKNQTTLPPQWKKSYLNFLQILMDLYNYIYKKRESSIFKIEEQLLKMEVVSFKIWLLEKINELKKQSTNYKVR